LDKLLPNQGGHRICLQWNRSRHIREPQFDRPSSSRVGHDEHLLAVRIFKRNVLEVRGRGLGRRTRKNLTLPGFAEANWRIDFLASATPDIQH
jgi:hypothetical protein